MKTVLRVLLRGLIGYVLGWHVVLVLLQLVGWGVLDTDTLTKTLESYVFCLRFLYTSGFELVAMLQLGGIIGMIVALGHMLWKSTRPSA